MGCLAHENATGRFPTGGWGFAWTGEADRGNDWRQPGGWIYNVFPYIEQQALHDMGAGMAINKQRYIANAARAQVPLNGLICPARRPAILYPTWFTSSVRMVNAMEFKVTVRSDYVSNGGDLWTSGSCPSLATWNLAINGNYESGPAKTTDAENPPGQMTANARTLFGGIAGRATGLFYVGSMIRMSDVTDGASQTYLIGEKYLAPDYYTTGDDYGDNECAYGGDNHDISRWSFVAPWFDTPGQISGYAFGSAHASGFQMAFCDGSVQMINYSIDPEVHRCLGNRKDGKAIDAKAF